MSECKYTRRDFLGLAGLGTVTMATLSCRSLPIGASRSQPFTFVQLCDPQLGMGGYEHDKATFRQAVLQINQLQPDFVVLCGDLVQDANPTSFTDFKTIQAAFKVPCHIVPGNHDVGGTPTRKSLQTYREVIGQDYYSIEHKGSVFVFVNTQLWKAPVAGETEKHDTWLRHTLETATGKKRPRLHRWPLSLVPREPGRGRGVHEHATWQTSRAPEPLSPERRGGGVGRARASPC